jgi:hypothetical protein
MNVPSLAASQRGRDLREPMITFASPSTELLCELAGEPVSVRAPESLHARLDELYAHVRANRVDSRFRVEVVVGGAAPERPAETPLRLAGEPEIWGEERDGELVLSNGHVSTVISYRTGSACVRIHRDTEGAKSLALHQFLPISIAELLRTSSVYAVHAAAIVRGGRALLLLGNSGDGKSTLAWRASQLGFRVLADDGLLLRARGSHVEASPFYREFSVEPSHADPAMIRRTVRTWKGDRAKVELPASMSADRAEVVAIALLDRRSTRCRVVPCTKTEALAELVHQSPFLFVQTSLAASHAATLRTLTQSCATTKLEMTTQVLTDDRLAGELLEQAFGSTATKEEQHEHELRG